MTRLEYIERYGLEAYEAHKEKMKLKKRAENGHKPSTRVRKADNVTRDYKGKTYSYTNGWKIGCVDKTKPDKLYIDKKVRVEDIDCQFLTKTISGILHSVSGIDNKLVVVEYLSEDNLNIQMHIKSEKGKEIVPTLVSILPQIDSLIC